MKEKSAFAQGCVLLESESSCRGSLRAFTLVELIVVISIITLLMSISVPVFSKVRQNARWIITMNNQREIVASLNAFACNNDNSYPDSTATINFGSRRWSWQAPTMMTAAEVRPGKQNRAMSSYLYDYIDNADVLFCPDAPHKNEFLQQAWEAGEDWNNPLTGFSCDQFSGVYCYYWNYIGYLGNGKPPFRGPRGVYDNGTESTLLVSCYLGYDYYRSPDTFVSCEKFDGAEISPGTEVSSDLWTRGDPDMSMDVNSLNIRLHGGYVDGHVESYSPSETVRMNVAGSTDGSQPYYNGFLGPGLFFIPEKALPQRICR
ncbi:MAG TPA: type II secretion system protein [Sedimentisphaerales bacterium]|nr:type II secretion system protein [Sedimentisphaerales bacterium]